MSDARPRGRRRWLVWGAVVVVLLVAAVVIVRTVVFRDQARAVSPSEAVDRYRSEVSGPASTAPAMTSTMALTTTVTATVPSTTATTATTTTVAAPEPVPLVAPGVYRYTTTGSEQVDALDG